MQVEEAKAGFFHTSKGRRAALAVAAGILLPASLWEHWFRCPHNSIAQLALNLCLPIHADICRER